MRTIYINGKFTAQRTTGVQRFAHHLVRALDRCAPATPSLQWVLLCPPEGGLTGLQHVQVQTVGPRGLPLHLWEQGVLPLAARHGLLLNLAGSAPLFVRRQCVTFHDAAVFDHPQAYTPSFATWYRWAFRWLAPRVQRVMTVSNFSRARLAFWLGLEADRIVRVPNGADHLLGVKGDDRIRGRLGLQGQRWFVAVGSRNPLKNVPLLLEAWRHMDRPADLRLVLVGGSHDQVFAGGRAPRDLPEGVVQAGVVDDPALKSLVQGALALVCPSLHEGFGLPPLEAQALGCPVAVSRVTALPEVCGDAALYFDPRSAAELAACLQRLHSEPALRQQLAAAGLHNAAGFTWDGAARALLLALPVAGR
jgi:glycosyltransferase involved in cell wall biosynthesis